MTRPSLFPILAVLLLSAAPVAAQPYVGFWTGLTEGSLQFESVPTDFEASRRSGGAVGAILGYGLTKQWALHAEPMYVEKGGDLALSDSASASFSLTYLEVPLHAKLSFVNATAGPYLMAGPYLAYRLDAARNPVESDETDFTDATARYDLGVSLGGGVAYPVLGRLSVVVEGRYMRGLVALNESAGEETFLFDPGTEAVTTQSFQLTTGLVLRLGPGGCR